MSNAVSALSGATATGFATVTETGLRGMITLRGDLASSEVQAAIKAATGLDAPDQRAVALAGDTGVAWMSPDELLVMVPYAQAAEAVDKMTDSFGGTFALAVDVSDARAVFRIEGQGAREVLAKLSPVDLSPAAFTPGMIRRTRLAQVPAAFWMVDDHSFDLVCFRSVATYAFDALKGAAATGGEVGYF